MDNLRWILLISGLGIVLGIYLFSMYQQHKHDLPRRRRQSREDPVIGNTSGANSFEFDDDMDSVVNQVGEFYADEEPGLDPMFESGGSHERFEDDDDELAIEPAAAPTSPDKVFTLYVMAPRGVPFRGPILMGALAHAQMQFGDMNIFHRSTLVNGQEKILFSAANIKEPGIFDMAAIDEFTTEGIVLFFQIPGGVDGVQAFDAMVESARIMADDLDSAVCDATRSILTNQTISHMREEVISYQLQQRVANAAS